MLPRARPAPADIAHVNSVSRIKTDFALQRQEKALGSDPKYKKYQTHVEKTLATFESVAEWPDFITFLAKLLKTLQSYPQFTVIPHKLTVAKRLAQCLNPALPTGVHQRALDVYVHILNTIGPDNLRRDLPAWSSGLFPFFQYAATSVRPIVLGIYSKFYLPIQESLRPCTKAFILALLPGLEEETSEFFEKVSSLLDQLSGTVSPPFFFQHLWLILMTAPNSRVSALNYLAKRLPPINPQDRITPIVGDDPGLMIRGFSAALDQGQLLVQRGILDLLCSALQLEGKGFKSEVRPEDQVMLVRSALAIVLRRDLSLSRRLYTWLLGKSESSQTQIEHFKTHALAIVSRTIREDWSRASNAQAQGQDHQRPFRIFVSLLDRWEIGSVLTQHLVLELFAALESTLKVEGNNDELLVTASMLFEGLDPYLTWQQFFLSLRDQLQSAKPTSDKFRLVSFICHTFRFNDAEIQRLHVPLVSFALLDLIQDALNSDTAVSQADKLNDALQLLHELLEEIPASFYGPPETQELTKIGDESGTAKAAAADFYSANNITEAHLPDASIGPVLHAHGVQALLNASATAARGVSTAQASCSEAQLSVFSSLLDAVAQLLAHKAAVHICWVPDAWIDVIIAAVSVLPGTQAGFDCLAASIHALAALHHAPMEPKLDIDSSHVMNCLVDKLISFLAPAYGPVHVEAVRLLWTIESLTMFNYIESHLCDRMSSPNERLQADAFQAFGNLWRLSDDEQIPGRALVAPLFLVLDGARSENFATRQAAEGWMRCHFKSYVRLLDVLFVIISDASIKRTAFELTTVPSTVTLYHYNQPFDQAQVFHALSNLHNLFLTRGAGFMKVARTSLLQQSIDPEVLARAKSASMQKFSYLEAFCGMLVEFLVSNSSDLPDAQPSTMDLQLQSISIDLLQIFLQRSDLEQELIYRIRHAFLTRLLSCIQYNHQTLQNKLLHALHATFTAKSAHRRRSSRLSVSETQRHEGAEATNDQLLVHVLVQGMTTQIDSASVHHWVDFLFLSVAQFHQPLDVLVYPLIQTVILRLRSVIERVKDSFDSVRKGKLVASGANDTDFVALAGLLERLMTYAIDESQQDSGDHLSPRSEKPPGSNEASTGFLTYMSGVLGSSETPAMQDVETVTSAPLIINLSSAVDVLSEAYAVSLALRGEASDESSSQGFILSRINGRTYKTMERLYKSLPAQVVESLILQWALSEGTSKASHVSDLLQKLAPSAQTVVATTCDRISLRTPAKAEKSRSAMLLSELSDDSLYAFLEGFIAGVEPPVAISIWNAYSGFLREAILTVGSSANFHFLPSLRCLVVLADKMAMTPALEDRRLRRELHDVFQRLLDATLSLAARSSDQLRRIKKASKTSIEATEDEKETNNGFVEGQDISISDATPNSGKSNHVQASIVTSTNGLQELDDLLAAHVLPKLRAFHFDTDRIALLCTSIMQTCIVPSFSKRTRTFEVDDHVFRLLAAVVQIQQAQKTWKPAVAEWYYDNRLFSSGQAAASQWQPIIQRLMASDKERFVDLISTSFPSNSEGFKDAFLKETTDKITTTTSANIFANRELEAISKAFSIRRLAFTIWSGDRNRYLTQLPTIQEKLVEVLRANVGDIVHCEVYLCLRVLLCRISQEHLASFWPIVLTEMLRCFEGLLDGSTLRPESLNLILGACKFLDLLLTLETEDFQIHQWMFVTDTVDAVYPPDGWSPQAIMDRISIMLSDHRASSTTASGAAPQDGEVNVITVDAVVLPSRGLAGPERRRRPLLANIRQKTKLDSLASLEPFFGRISLYSFESAYAQGLVDWASIGMSIESDIFEG